VISASDRQLRTNNITKLLLLSNTYAPPVVSLAGTKMVARHLKGMQDRRARRVEAQHSPRERASILHACRNFRET
jgi:hypothetical protein